MNGKTQMSPEVVLRRALPERVQLFMDKMILKRIDISHGQMLVVFEMC